MAPGITEISNETATDLLGNPGADSCYTAAVGDTLARRSGGGHVSATEHLDDADSEQSNACLER